MHLENRNILVSNLIPVYLRLKNTKNVRLFTWYLQNVGIIITFAHSYGPRLCSNLKPTKIILIMPN